MIKTREIRLDGPGVDPDSEEPGWWVDERRITVRDDAFVTVYSLPKGARVVSVLRLGDGRGRLSLGGFTSTSVTITGPLEVLNQLRERVL